jgi:hypothetical protein
MMMIPVMETTIKQEISKSASRLWRTFNDTSKSSSNLFLLRVTFHVLRAAKHLPALELVRRDLNSIDEQMKKKLSIELPCLLLFGVIFKK